VDEAAEALRIHRNVARSRLDRLVEASLLEVGFERRSGRSGPGSGRPARIYSIAPELSAIEFPLRRFGSLIELLISALPLRGRARRLHEVGVAFGDELARSASVDRSRSLPEALAHVCEALGELGFHATVETTAEREGWVRTATCPLRPLVVANEDAAAVDSGMWTGLVCAALEGVDELDVVCQGHDCLSEHAPCRVRVRLRD